MDSQDTEWNDILRQHGILPPRTPPPRTPSPVPSKTPSYTSSKEDEFDDEETRRHLAARRAEIARAASTKQYGEVIEIQKSEFEKQVTESSLHSVVLVLLYKDTVPECAVLNNHLSVIAARYPTIKCTRIQSEQCIEGYPDYNLPTLLIYKDSLVKKTLVALRSTTLSDLEDCLASLDVLDPVHNTVEYMEESESSSDWE